MGLLNKVSVASSGWTLGIGLLLGLGCSTNTPNQSTVAMNGAQGVSGAGAANSGSTAGPGLATGVGNTGTSNPASGTAGTGTKPSTGGTAGSGEFPTGASGKTGGTAGTSAPMTGGTAGTGTMGTSGTGGTEPGGVCDKSTFIANCSGNGSNWGTDVQKGPCSTQTTIYGIDMKLGPYGARAKINIGSGAGGVDDSSFCNSIFIPSFGADPVGSAELENTHDLDFDKYSVFYPGCMADGEKFPLITWGNGTCAMPEGYGPLLRYVASFGYIVVAANNREVGDGSPMTHGIDVMFAENDKMDSEFYQHIDKDRVGAMGHSQGAAATVTAAADPRIKAIIAWNSGTSSDKPFLDVSGDMDLGAGTDPSGIRNATMGAAQPGAWLWFHQVPNDVNCKMAGDPKCSTTGTTAPGHLTLMMEPERVSDIAVAWWDMMLKQKPEAKNMFLGASCKLCDGSAYPSMWGATGWRGSAMPSLEFGHNGALQ